jgi:hypothetical protein
VRCGETAGSAGSSAGPARSRYIVRTIECGNRHRLSSGTFSSDVQCNVYLRWCMVAPGVTIDPTTQVVAYQTIDTITGLVIDVSIVCDVPIATPLPSTAAINQEITKRAPAPQTTTGGLRYLVGTAIVFYLQPPAPVPSLADVTVPPFTLAGHSFTVQLHLTQTDWDWGDGQRNIAAASDTTSATGRPFTVDGPCPAIDNCPDYIAHTYRGPGSYTVTTRAHWSGTYRLDGGTQDIPITGDVFRDDPTGRHLTVRSAAAVLTAPQ